MRRQFIALAVGFTALAGLAGCGHPALSGTSAAAAVTPSPTPDAMSDDPYAFKDVPYQDYRQAAEQLSIPYGLLVSPTGFTEALSTLCRSTPADFTKLVDDQRRRAGSDSDGASMLQSMADEVQLRMSLSCPQRMTDWAAARADDQNNADAADTASPTPSDGSADSTTGDGGEDAATPSPAPTS